MLVIRIYDAASALTEQEAFALHIFLERRMFRRSDMIRGKIGKYAIIKFDACGTIQFQSLGRYLHDHMAAALFYHFTKQTVQLVGLRRRILGRQFFISRKGTDRSDQADFFSRVFQYAFDHISRCRLSLGSGQSDRCQFSCWITEIRR